LRNVKLSTQKIELINSKIYQINFNNKKGNEYEIK